MPSTDNGDAPLERQLSASHSAVVEMLPPADRHPFRLVTVARPAIGLAILALVASCLIILQNNGNRPLSADQLFRAVSPSVYVVEVTNDKQSWVSQGSGFLISADGLLVTNFHVIRDGSFAKIKTPNGQEIAVTGVIAADPDGDLALLQTDATGKPFLNLGPDNSPPIGTHVYTIGSPEGLANSLSDGLISGVRPDEQNLPMLQTTAPISHGSSGGPLLTPDGQVAGVTSAFYSDGQNLNLAVPASRIRQLLKERGPAVPLALASIVHSDFANKKTDVEFFTAISQQRFQDAADILESVQNRDTAGFWFASGYLADVMRDYDTAATDYRNALRFDANNSTLYQCLGRALVLQQKHNEAIGAFRSCVRLDPTNVFAWKSAAGEFLMQGNYGSVVTTAQRAIALTPDDALLYATLGIAYVQLKRFSDAADAYHKYAQLKPDDYVGYDGLGDVALGQDDYSSAEACYSQGLARNPTDSYAYLKLGIVRYHANDLATAVTDLRMAYQLDPNGSVGAGALEALNSLPAQ